MMTCDFKLDVPYPEPMVQCQSKEHAKILLEDLAGNVSEHSAINLYMFQNFTQACKCGWKDFAELVRGIALIEMKHLKLLGDTIALLGVTPVFKSIEDCCCEPWTADYVDFSACLNEMLEADIKGEIDAIKQYREHICLINDKCIQKLLERIIMDEQQHLKCFEQFYRALRCK